MPKVKPFYYYSSNYREEHHAHSLNSLYDNH